MTARPVKYRAQQTIRSAHRLLFRRPLPEKLSLYLHATAGREQALDELLGRLGEWGYTFCGPGEFLEASGRIAFLSFDDNYRSWLGALRVLDRHSARATFYVNSWPFRDRVGGADMRRYLERVVAGEETTLSTAELVEIADAGHVIGAHTHTHPILTMLPDARAREEIRVSKEQLEDVVQRPVRHFAYPFGMRRHFNQSLRRYCTSIGFATIANAIPCLQYAKGRLDSLHRSVWFLERPLAYNLDNLRIDGRVFHALTGRSAAGGAPS